MLSERGTSLMQVLDQLCVWGEANRKYNTLLVSYPIWYYREPLVVEKFLRSVDTAGKTILPFATSGGSPIEPSITTISKAAPKAKMGDALLANDTALVNPWLKKYNLIK